MGAFYVLLYRIWSITRERNRTPRSNSKTHSEKILHCQTGQWTVKKRHSQGVNRRMYICLIYTKKEKRHQYYGMILLQLIRHTTLFCYDSFLFLLLFNKMGG